MLAGEWRKTFDEWKSHEDGRPPVFILVCKDTKIAKGVFNEKEKKWEAGEEIPKGLWNEMFGDFSARTVHVRIIQTDDRKGIALEAPAPGTCKVLVSEVDPNATGTDPTAS